MTIVIAHIVHWPKSGIGTLVRQLTQHRQSNRHRYVIILLETDAASLKQFSAPNISIVGLQVSSNPILALLKLREALQTANIVHTHSFLPLLLSWMAISKKIRHIRTIHNSYPYFSLPDIRSKTKRLVEGFLISKLASELVSVSIDVQQALPWRNITSGSSIVIKNGLDLNKIRQTSDLECDIAKPDGLLIVALGRLEQQKGFDILLEAMALLRDTHGGMEQSTELWIIGDGGERSALQQQASVLKLNNIKFLGYQTDPYRHLACGDLFVLPSRFEGFALAPIEAMALGLPVLLTEIGGIASELTHMKNAHIVKKENPKDLADGLFTLLVQTEYRKKLAENGQSFALANYSIESCAERYCKIYSNTASSR